MKKKLTHQAPPAPKAKVAELSDNASFSQIVKFFNDNQKATVFFKAGGKIDKLVETNAVRWRLLLNEVDMHGTMGGINLSALGRELTKDEYIIILTQFCASVAGHDYSLTADGDYDGDGNFFQNAYHLRYLPNASFRDELRKKHGIEVIEEESDILLRKVEVEKSETSSFQTGDRVEIVGYEPLEGVHGVISHLSTSEPGGMVIEADNPPYCDYCGRLLFGIPVSLLRKESKGYLACHSKKIGSTKHSVEPAKVEQKPELEVCVGLVGGQICCSKLPEGVKLTIW
jgi:hypothetical protein